MAVYRGIEQQDILNSLQQAEDFIRRQDMGPTMSELLDNWLAQGPFSRVAAARDDESLAQVMEQVRAPFFSIFKDTITYHAKQDLAAGGGEALGLYKALADWDGLNGGRMWIDDLLVPGAMQKDFMPGDSVMRGQFEAVMDKIGERLDEANAHLIIQYAKGLSTEDVTPGAPFMQRFEAVVAEGKHHMVRGDILAAALIEAMPVLVETLKTADEVAARDLLLEKANTFGEGFGQFLEKILVDALQIPKRVPLLDPVSRFKNYGLEVENFRFFKEVNTIIDARLPEIEAVLKPFADRGEVIAKEIGPITMEPDFDLRTAPWGLKIRMTQEAAQALADAFPADKIIDHLAEKIAPRSQKPAGPKPKGNYNI